MVMRRFAMPENAHPLVRELARICHLDDRPLTGVSLEAGLAQTTVHSWFKRHSPSLENFNAVLNTLGYELQIRKTGDYICPACDGTGEAVNPTTGTADACGLCAFRAEAEYGG
jgi:hypothetical protein